MRGGAKRKYRVEELSRCQLDIPPCAHSQRRRAIQPERELQRGFIFEPPAYEKTKSFTQGAKTTVVQQSTCRGTRESILESKWTDRERIHAHPSDKKTNNKFACLFYFPEGVR